MAFSVFDIFTIGIGPSSSHTVGPMKAAKIFLDYILKNNLLTSKSKIKCDFYGSLALTGKGHGTDKAFILGIQGYEPETINSDLIPDIIQNVKDHKALKIKVNGIQLNIPFNHRGDLKFHRRVSLPYHPNGMAFALYDDNNNEIHKQIFYSIGGGFILSEDEILLNNSKVPPSENSQKYPFKTAADLISSCKLNNFSISNLMLENERALKSNKEIEDGLDNFWNIMEKCVARGLRNEGILPGGLKVIRRAPSIYKKLSSSPERSLMDPLAILDWVNLYALAVNEENAAGGQVLTAPTNGAAGIIPAVLHYYTRFCPQATAEGVRNFLLTSAAIGLLYKRNASISGAEVGCQGEVGVACSMAAGALCEVLGGNVDQVANAAEIGMEHNLGLTCDPIGGLVQIPCIERNAMGAIKAINAARIAMQGNGEHFVSLDKVIQTMKQTGKDMKKQYKETSRGGLAVNLTEC